MIKLNKLNKYYNRKKSNEIHVIHDITLELPERGLVVLLGPSGSGKTTLLNVLGGLDKVQSGSIEFEKQIINRYSSRVWDEIRNKDVGYIFQNYNLLKGLTVYDNIALTLNMVGVVDKDEIDKRIDYILSNIGMGNFRKRRAFQLSGGQQQRVAIARALAKNPKVIIADEPTGNLDSKNTIDIMNIIKKISKTKLVVLVTHEEELADFYADRVIKLKDGQIIEDYGNNSTTDLNLKHDTDIYLKDLNELPSASNEVVKLKVYSDELVDPNFDVKLIVKNKTLYLDIKTEDYNKIKLITKDSEVKILDKHFVKVTKDDFEESSFDLDGIVSEELTIDKRSVITFRESLKLAIARLGQTTRVGKLFFVGFIGGAILIAIAVGMLSSVYHLDSSKFLTGAKETVVFDYDEYTYDELLAHEDEESIEYINLITGVTQINAVLPVVYQAWDTDTQFFSKPVISSNLDSSELMIGRNVEDYDEIVLDYLVVETLLDSTYFQNSGITTVKDMLNVELHISLVGLEANYDYQLKIVGISDTGNKVYYAKEETMYMIETSVAIYEVFEDMIVISEGELPEDNENILMFDDPDISIPMASRTLIQLDTMFHVSGLYTTTEDVIPDYMISLDSLKEIYYVNTYTERGQEIYVYSNDIEGTIDYFEDLGIESYSLYEIERREYRINRLAESVGTMIFTFVVLASMSASYYFIIRSSLISRIYEVSVYRALGVSKGDIRKIFITEIVLITTITSLVGYLGTNYLLIKVQGITEDFYEFIHISVYSFFGGILLIYFINILSGLIPVSGLLRKTPAEILSKYDF